MNNIYTSIGKFIAVFQDTADTCLSWGFKKLSKAGGSNLKKNPKTRKDKVTNVLKSGAKNLGTIGNAYYDEYERLKEKKAKKEESN